MSIRTAGIAPEMSPRIGAGARLFVVIFLLAFPVFYVLLAANEDSDTHAYIQYARDLKSFADVMLANFVTQVLFKLSSVATGLDYSISVPMVLAACEAVMGVAILFEMHRRNLGRGPILDLLVVAGILFASHIYIFTGTHSVYLGYISPVSYHSATQQISKMFSLILYFIYTDWLFGSRPASPGKIAAMAALCFLSAFAKPSFVLIFLPAAGLFSAYYLVRRDYPKVIGSVAGVIVPCVAVLILQFALTYGKGGDNSIAVSPFAVLGYYSATPFDMYLKLGMSLLFPLATLALLLPLVRVDGYILFSMLMLFGGTFASVVFMEQGDRMLDGNFGAAGEHVMFIAYVESAFLILRAQPADHWRVKACWALFGLHVLSGIGLAVAFAVDPFGSLWEI